MQVGCWYRQTSLRARPWEKLAITGNTVSNNAVITPPDGIIGTNVRAERYDLDIVPAANVARRQAAAVRKVGSEYGVTWHYNC